MTSGRAALARLLLITLGAWPAACWRGDTSRPPAARDAGPRVSAVAPAVPAAEPGQVAAPGVAQALAAEEREANPDSATVTLTLSVSPPVQGVVSWGRRRLGTLRPGAMTVTFQRPRGSGPVDVVIRAGGFMPYHVRLFTDRDDKLGVRLVRPEDAPGMLGYRPGKPPAAATP